MPTLTHSNSRARRTLGVSTLALAGLLAACTTGSGPSPSPTNAPTASPPFPTAAPTPTPTPTAPPSPTFGVDQIEHPTGATDIVLRASRGGGFVPVGFLVTEAPQFTLYGDGTVVFQQVDTRQGGAFGGQAYLPWLTGHLDEEGVQALLRYALGTGRLLNAKQTYDNMLIADAPTTVFNLNAGGLQKVVSVYALMEQSQPGPDTADLTGFSQLFTLLSNFETQDGIGDVVPYDAAAYRVVLIQAFGDPVGAPKAWPWDDLTLDDFPAADEPNDRSLIMTRDQVALLLEVPTGGHPGIWVKAPDDTLVTFGVRPLLPDEVPAD